MKLRKGFTLIELLVVVAIIGILITIAVPRFTRMTGGAREAAAKANHRMVVSAVSLYIAQNNGALPTNDTDIDQYLPGTGLAELQDNPAGAFYDFTEASGVLSVKTTLDGAPLIEWES